MSTNFENIYEYIKELTIIDTHEHLRAEESLPEKQDLLSRYLEHYIRTDVQTAGMVYQENEEGRSYLDMAQDPSIPVIDRWKLLEPYWENSRYTGYAQALDITARDLYGVDRIDGSTIEELSKKFTERNRPGYIHQVLEHCKIEKVVNDLTPEVNKPFPYAGDSIVKLVAKFPYFWGRWDVMRLSKWTGMRIHSLQDLDDACEAYVDLAVKRGAIALKCGYAYETTINFAGVSRAEAEEVFVRLMDQGDCNGITMVPLQKYIGERFLQIAEKREMVVQVHTGLLEGFSHHSETLAHSNPLELEHVIRKYTHIKFDLMHLYPFQDVAASLAKMYPNVYLDMAWTHIASPVAAVRMLGEWLETVPKNKIMGFGGDYNFVDGVYGHQYMARRNIAKALASRVDVGSMDLNSAKKIAKDLLYNNPKNLFEL